MDGCIYRTKDGECELWENDRNHKPFCDPEHCDNIAPSNADRIRSMTDEELAEWLEAHCYQYGWLDWLKQEAAE